MGQNSGGALLGGHRLEDNYVQLTNKFRITENGYFGQKSGDSSKVRQIITSDPLKEAFRFTQLASDVPVRCATITDKITGNVKGMKYQMRDGSHVVFRYYSTSDGSPAVSLNVVGNQRIKSQKIHFIKKGM